MKKAITFEQFWDAYGLKRDKIAAERAWNKLPAKDRQAAFSGISAYRQDCADHNRMMMYAQGYITHRRWEDDFTVDCLAKKEEQKAKDDNTTKQAYEAGTGIRQGFRLPTDEELNCLENFKNALMNKPPVKAMTFVQYKSEIIPNIRIAYVDEKRGTIFLCVMLNGKRERITNFMIDYYDSYADFYRILANCFDIRRITFDV